MTPHIQTALSNATHLAYNTLAHNYVGEAGVGKLRMLVGEVEKGNSFDFA